MVQTRRNSYSVPSLPPALASKPSTSNDANTSTLSALTSSRPTAAARSSRPPLAPGHFLRNVNLDHCSDLLSIPDPPSPPRHRRRQSSPIMTGPLRDLTNDDDVLSSSQPPSPASVTGSKRSRKSLCHVPSPPITDQEKESETDDDDNDSVKEESAATLDESKAHSEMSQSNQAVESSVIYFDEDDDSTALSASKRRKRRESMILPKSAVAPLEQEDVKESDEDVTKDSVTALELDHGVQDEAEGVPTSRRASKRQSMVLPSDVALFQKEVASEVLLSNDEAGTKHSATSEGPMLTNLDGDVEEEEETPSPAKRARRQSILLPSDVASLKDDGASEFVAQLQHNNHDSKSISCGTSMDEKGLTARHDDIEPKSLVKGASKLPEDIDGEEMKVPQEATGTGDAASLVTVSADDNNAEHIRRLVRQYCALPMAERHLSKQAEEIERLTSYVLIPPAMKQRQERIDGVDLNWSGSPKQDDAVRDPVVAKRELLLKLGDMVDLMDKRKSGETKEMETRTGCRAVKTRSGKYRYFDLYTNDKVKAADYEERYLAEMKKLKEECRQRIREFLASVGNLDEVQCMIHEQAKEPCTDEMEVCVADRDQSLPLGASIAVAKESPVTTVTDDNAKTSSEQTADSNADMEVDLSPSETCDTDNVELNDTSSSSPTEAPEIETGALPPSDATDELPPPNGEDDDGTESSDLLLPLPSRDEASDDPALAAAEARLWAAIDCALATYSREVIAIREAREQAGIAS